MGTQITFFEDDDVGNVMTRYIDYQRAITEELISGIMYLFPIIAIILTLTVYSFFLVSKKQFVVRVTLRDFKVLY